MATTYPEDIIVGSWTGIHDGTQASDDTSITTYEKRQGKYKYVGVLTEVSNVLKMAKFSKGEETVWLNPTGDNGVYKGIDMRRQFGTGHPSLHECTVRMLSRDRTEGKDDIGITYGTRVKKRAPEPPEPQVGAKEPCVGLQENSHWLYGVTVGDAKSFLLSPPADTGEYSKKLVDLQAGEFFLFRFKVVAVKSSGKHGRVLEFLNRTEKRSGWVLSFAEGSDSAVGGYLVLNGEYQSDHSFDVSWYKPGEYNLVTLFYCRDGTLRLRANGVDIDRYITNNSGGLPIAVRAYAVDVVFDG